MNTKELLEKMKIICNSYVCETCPLYSHNKLSLGCMMRNLYELDIENIIKILNDWHIVENWKEEQEKDF